MTERSEAFLDLGYTSPDDGENLHIARLAAQKIDKVTDDQARRTARRAPRRPGTRDFENDADYADEMSKIPPDLEYKEEEKDPQLPIDAGHQAAHALGRELAIARIKRETGDDPVLFQARLRVYDEKHPKR